MHEPSDSAWPSGHVGYIAVVGRPNVGKSTFLNAVLGETIFAVSSVPQTTRRQWLCVHSTPSAQMVFLDTPGVHTPRRALGEAMIESVDRSLRDADVVLCIADPTRAPGSEDREVGRRVVACGKPTVIALNKDDTASPDQIGQMEAFYREIIPAALAVFRIAAVRPASLVPLLDDLAARLPTGPFLYPPDAMTTATERDLAADLVREAAILHLRDELPHAVAAAIEQWDDGADRLRLQAVLFVERDRHKQIVIGQGGATIGAIRRSAETRLAAWLGRPVTLRIWVKVASDWRRRRGVLRDLGLLAP
jgi:GTP-binding protein Era